LHATLMPTARKNGAPRETACSSGHRLAESRYHGARFPIQRPFDFLAPAGRLVQVPALDFPKLRHGALPGRDQVMMIPIDQIDAFAAKRLA
jgi:hypothetical protein